MQDLDENTVTEAALAQMANTPDPRLKEIMDAAVRHLHAFARDVRLTPAEWLTGIQFLTAVGRPAHSLSSSCWPMCWASVRWSMRCTTRRAFRHAEQLPARSTAGRAGAARRQHRGNHRCRSVVYGRVTDNDGKPVPNALVQVWQTSEHGLYDLQAENAAEMMDLRANFRADADGRYHFRTVRPLGYSIPMDGPVGEMVMAQQRHGFRPSHIHFLIGGEGYRELVTALYFGDDEHIDSDTVFGVSGSLVVGAKDDPASPVAGLQAVRYDFRLAHAEG